MKFVSLKENGHMLQPLVSFTGSACFKIPKVRASKDHVGEQDLHYGLYPFTETEVWKHCITLLPNRVVSEGIETLTGTVEAAYGPML